MTAIPAPLDGLVAEIRACRLCRDVPEPRPVLHVSAAARLCVIGQAPGLRVHETGLSFNDRSGDRLRDWMGIDRATFYDEKRVAIAAMAFCFPGYDANGHDRPPPRRCAAHWRERLFCLLPKFELMLLVGSHAQAWHLGNGRLRTVSDTVRAWRDYAPGIVPLPHPSWRNTGWLKRHPWFECELLPVLRSRVQEVLA